MRSKNIRAKPHNVMNKPHNEGTETHWHNRVTTLYTQGSHGSWKTWKVVDFSDWSWKILALVMEIE